jgi:DNA invertase Pin-like site-specific DNA recombinase
MTDSCEIQPSHTQRAAYVYIRQSTPGQVEHNRESPARQYALADRASQLGWAKEQVVVIDEDLGLSGSSTDKRSGFVRLTSDVALARVGIVLGLEVSRLARNNADWYRLLELCGVTDTLIFVLRSSAKSSSNFGPFFALTLATAMFRAFFMISPISARSPVSGSWTPTFSVCP